MMHAQIEEKEFRFIVDEMFQKIGAAFDSVDPDDAEFEMSLGSAAITFKDRSKCILSVQPSVKQVWLANAAEGIAFHFDYDTAKRKWFDDKGKNVELLSYLTQLVQKKTDSILQLN